MTKKRKLILAMVLMLVVLLLAGAVSTALLLGGDGGASSQMARGQKYLDSGDYTNAVLCYQKAIHADPSLPDAYLGLAKSYLNQGKNILAKSVLTKGFDVTGSTRIKLMLQNNFVDSSEAAMQAEASETTAGTTEKAGDGRFNYDILRTIARNTYDDYRRADSISSEGVEGVGYVVYTKEAKAVFSAENAVEPAIDSITGKPYATRRPSIITMNEISSLFGGRTEMPLKELRGASLDGIRVVEDDTHGWVVTFSYNGCVAKIASDEDGTIHSGAWNEFVPAHGTEESSVTISGRVVDATTGSGVSDAELKIRTGGQQTGTPLATAKANSNGEYGFDVEDGDYTVEVSKNGYATEFFPVYANQNSAEPKNLTITPLLQEGEIRIVLEWGNYPTDLDSHLSGRTDSGANVTVNFRHRDASADGRTVARLDVDDTDGFGPETTTIYDVNGVYSFRVIDFLATGDMSQSGATVKVYTPNQSAPTVINICGGLEFGWDVCVIDHGEVQVINSSYAVSDDPDK